MTRAEYLHIYMASVTRAEYPGCVVMVQCLDTGVVLWPLTLRRLETLTTDICFYSELRRG